MSVRLNYKDFLRLELLLLKADCEQLDKISERIEDEQLKRVIKGFINESSINEEV